MELPLNPDNLQDREKLRKLFRIKRVEGEMMKDRGYSLTEVYLLSSDRNFRQVDLSGLQNPNSSLETLLQYRQQNAILQSRQEFSSIYVDRKQNKMILVLYLSNDPGKAVGKKYFKFVLEFISTQQYHNIILITETGLNANSSNIVRQFIGYNIEVFKDIELAFNPLKHSLAPISIIHIPGKQVQEWSKSEDINQPEKLPMMLDIDPIAKWYGASPYDVFQHELLGIENDKIGFYRIVRQTPIERKTTVSKMPVKGRRCGK